MTRRRDSGRASMRLSHMEAPTGRSRRTLPAGRSSQERPGGWTDPPSRYAAALYLSYAAVFAFFLGRNVALRLRFEDALIVLRYARNLAQGHGFVFNPGERVLGVTTPLHTLVSTLWVALSPANAPALQNLAGVVCLVAEGFVVLLLARRMGFLWPGLFAALLVLGNFNLSYLYLGMEVHLFAFLVLLAFYLYVDDRETACGVVLGVAFVTRYDAALMAALVGAALLVGRRRFPWRLTLGFAVPALPWLVFAQLYFGSILPNALGAKEGFVDAGSYLHRVFFEYKAAFKNLVGLYTPVELLRAGISYVFLVPVVAGVAAAARRDRRFVLLGVYPVLHVLVYALIGPDPGFTWHYYVLNPTLYLFFAVGVYDVLRWMAKPVGERLAPRFPAPVRYAPAAVLVVALMPLLVHGARQMGHRYQPDPHTAQLFEVAAWLKARYGEETTLLQPAIGIIGYETNFRMIDHAGLVTPGLRFFNDADATPMGEVLRRFEPDLVLASAASPADVAAFGYRPVKAFAGPWTFTLYERGE